MAYKLTLPLLNRYAKYFNALDKAGIEFEIQVQQQYDYGTSNYNASLTPLIKNVKNLETLAKIWEAGTSSIKVAHITDFEGLRAIYQKPTASAVTADLYKKSNATVKFYASEVFSTLPQLGVYILNEDPVQKQIGDHTYRIACTNGDYYNSEIIYCAPETNPYFNYIDKGHVIVSTSAPDKPESYMFVTNMLTLDMNYIMAAFVTYPESVKDILQHNGAFIQAKDARANLLRVERAIPARFQEAYQKMKAAVQADFEKNTSNVMIGKLTRNEAPFVDLNNIRISKTRAIYEHVSIEADNLAEVVFAALNPNEEWDIFTLINIYTDWVENSFKALPLNTAGTGFKDKKTFRFKINDIPLKLECFTDNTRRAINDTLINLDELSKVMRRASCYENEKDYNAFVQEVGRISLYVRDILSNGMPVKTVFLDVDANSYGKPATQRHPKLRFTKKVKSKTQTEDTGFYLVINHLDDKGKITKTTNRRIGKFVEFIRKVEQVNKKHYVGYHTNEYTRTHEGGYEPRDSKPNRCALELLTLMKEYVAAIDEDDTKTLVGSINKERSESEKKSMELLNLACKAVGATKAEKNGKHGYRVPGQKRTYFVEEDSLRVYDNDTNQYYCVVNKGNPDAQGVGKDALVTRLYALHNDSMVANLVTTLR